MLLVADLHLTANPRDEYRWRLLPWLEEQIRTLPISALVVLGDLCEAKDYHSARLVNRIVDAFAGLQKASIDSKRPITIWLLRGNHDGTDPTCPYFRFLRELPYCRYIEAPYLGPLGGRDRVLFLPHTKEPENWDRELLQQAEVIFMHQTVSGAKSETGVTLEGMSAQALAAVRRADIWSGDVHVPQQIGAVNYVGAPYPVRFGDAFKPRAVLLEKGLRQARDLEPPRFGRHSITLFSDLSSPAPIAVASGDQAKVRVRMTPSEFVDWEKVKRAVLEWAKAETVELCGLEVEKIEEQRPKLRARGVQQQAARSPEQELSVWCERQKLEPVVVEAGKQILKAALK